MDGYEEMEGRFRGYHLLADDVWEEFQIDGTHLQTLPVADTNQICRRNCQVKYDCMWNGHCKGAHGNRSCNSKSVATPVDVKPVQAQQSLLKPDLKLSVDPNTVVPMMPPFYYSLQTPPISDDEDTKPTQILQSLQTALAENELDLDVNDGDLSDYFKEDGKDWGFFDDELAEEAAEEEEEEEEKEEKDVKDVKPTVAEQQENEKRAFYAATDHSYHKGTMLGGGLGIDTPSDSEEEIDVVSLGGDKFTTAKTAANALPNNPSTKDRRHIQRTMQSRFPQGVKTIMPVKRAAPAPKKETRGRRQYKRVKGNHRQYKRKYGYGHSSDSEPEPSEKRHLHNNMERQRRIDLRNLFTDLKKLLPDVSKKPRAAKVAILRGASAYCDDLTYTEQMLKKRIDAMRQQQARLRAQVSKLRRDVVAKR